MSETLQKFVFTDSNEVRVILQNEEPWFVAKDACNVLGIDTNHIKETVGEKRLMYLTLRSTEVWNGKGHAPLLVNESGLYKLIMKSRKPNAEAFQDWVTDEVLPSIRKHGAYMTPQTAQNVLATPENAIVLAKALLEEHEHVQKLESENASLERSCKETTETLVKTKGELETCQQALAHEWKPCPEGRRPQWVRGHWRFVKGEGKTIPYVIEEDKMKKTKKPNEQLKLSFDANKSDDMEKYDSHTCLDDMTKSVVVTEVKDDGK